MKDNMSEKVGKKVKAEASANGLQITLETSKENLNTEKIPAFCDFRRVRSWVLVETWRQSDNISKQGIPISPELWGQIMKRNWMVAKKKAGEVCKPVSKEDLENLLNN